MNYNYADIHRFSIGEINAELDNNSINYNFSIN